MFVSFGLSGMFLADSGAFDENGNFDLEGGLEILEELDRLPFVYIDVDSLRDNVYVECLEEQRGVEACIEIYQPVCGEVSVECVREPCNAVKEEYSNPCYACKNSRVSGYYPREC